MSGTRDAGLIDIKGQLRQGVTLEEAEEAVWEELDKLMAEPLNDYELEKVKNKQESVQTFGNINYQRVAYKLAWFELNGRAEQINDELACFRAVDAECLQRVASELFRKDNANVLHYKKA